MKSLDVAVNTQNNVSFRLKVVVALFLSAKTNNAITMFTVHGLQRFNGIASEIALVRIYAAQ